MMGGRCWSLRKIGQSIGVLGKLTAPWLTTGAPEVPVQSPDQIDDAQTLGRLVRDFGLKLPHVFMGLKDEATFAQAQLIHERIADIAIDLYVSACVLSRLDFLLTKAASNGKPTAADPFADVTSGKYFLKLAYRRIHERFAALDDNDDDVDVSGESAKSMLRRGG